MANYKETPVSGTKWQRCRQVVIDNPIGGAPYVTFNEEQVVNLGDESFIRNVQGMKVDFVQDEVINLLDPVTGAPTGETMTQGKLYQAFYSLYIAKALARDA